LQQLRRGITLEGPRVLEGNLAETSVVRWGYLWLGAFAGALSLGAALYKYVGIGDPTGVAYNGALVWILVFAVLAVMAWAIAAVGNSKPRPIATSAATPAMRGIFPLNVRDRATWLLQQIRAEYESAQRGRKRWLGWSLTIAGLTALFSGASGVAGLLDTAPDSLRLTLAILALFGAALAALSVSLGASERYATFRSRSDALYVLVRELEYRIREGELDDDQLSRFQQRFLTSITDTSAIPVEGPSVDLSQEGPSNDL
jgi:hypothetical protein